ncbi:MAG: ATP-binding protein [Planctomycetota bacterium]|nr:ATP-binding protein [Planctomycetota bacterium]
MSFETTLKGQNFRAQYAEIAELAGGLAHEIKNPLSTIGLNLELLAEDLEEPQTPREHRMLTKVRNVQRECEHLGEILEAFLQFAKAGEPELDVCDLKEVIRDFLEFYRPAAEAAGIDVSPHLAADLPTVRIDRHLLRQVLLNLAINAQHAMPNGGLLEIQASENDGCIELRVIDNGCGMDEATLEKMWHAFFSRKPGGSGLGLPTVRKIIEAHGGSVACESAVGQGTRFTIRLPVA